MQLLGVWFSSASSLIICVFYFSIPLWSVVFTALLAPLKQLYVQQKHSVEVSSFIQSQHCDNE